MIPGTIEPNRTSGLGDCVEFVLLLGRMFIIKSTSTVCNEDAAVNKNNNLLRQGLIVVRILGIVLIINYQSMSDLPDIPNNL